MHPDRLVVREKVPVANVASLREMHQRAGAIMDMDRWHPPVGFAKLQNATAGHDRIDHVVAEPWGIAVDASWQGGDDR